jgi:hypothetical protein
MSCNLCIYTQPISLISDDAPWSIVDSANKEITLTTSILNFTNLGESNNTFAKNVDLLGTPRTEAALGYFSRLDLDHSFNPNKYRIRIEVEGVDVLQGYGFMEVKGVEFDPKIGLNVYKTFVEAGLTSWKRDFSELSINALELPINENSVVARNSWDRTGVLGTAYDWSYIGATYVPIHRGEWNGLEQSSLPNRAVSYFQLTPSPYVKALLEEATRITGWKFIGDFYNSEFFEGLILPYSNSKDGFTGDLARAATVDRATVSGGTYTSGNPITWDQDVPSTINPTNGAWVSPGKGRILYKVELVGRGGNGAWLRVNVNGSPVFDTNPYFYHNLNFNTNVNSDYELFKSQTFLCVEPGDEVTLEVDTANLQPLISPSPSFFAGKTIAGVKLDYPSGSGQRELVHMFRNPYVQGTTFDGVFPHAEPELREFFEPLGIPFQSIPNYGFGASNDFVVIPGAGIPISWNLYWLFSDGTSLGWTKQFPSSAQNIQIDPDKAVLKIIPQNEFCYPSGSFNLSKFLDPEVSIMSILNGLEDIVFKTDPLSKTIEMIPSVDFYDVSGVSEAWDDIFICSDVLKQTIIQEKDKCKNYKFLYKNDPNDEVLKEYKESINSELHEGEFTSDLVNECRNEKRNPTFAPTGTYLDGQVVRRDLSLDVTVPPIWLAMWGDKENENDDFPVRHTVRFTPRIAYFAGLMEDRVERGSTHGVRWRFWDGASFTTESLFPYAFMVDKLDGESYYSLSYGTEVFNTVRHSRLVSKTGIVDQSKSFVIDTLNGSRKLEIPVFISSKKFWNLNYSIPKLLTHPDWGSFLVFLESINDWDPCTNLGTAFGRIKFLGMPSCNSFEAQDSRQNITNWEVLSISGDYSTDGGQSFTTTSNIFSEFPNFFFAAPYQIPEDSLSLETALNLFLNNLVKGGADVVSNPDTNAGTYTLRFSNLKGVFIPDTLTIRNIKNSNTRSSSFVDLCD